MTAFSFRMPVGIPGEPNRSSALTIEAQNVTPSGTTGAPVAYGVPLVVDNTAGNVGNMRTVAATDTAVYGILVRPFPTVSSQDAVGTSTPPKGLGTSDVGIIDVLVRGYIHVLMNPASAAAVKGGPVYVWAAATSGSHFQGGYEAASSGGNTITLASSYFVGPADANGITEIGFNI